MCTIILSIMDLEKLLFIFMLITVSGQNKNNYFIWYLAWRTILQLHHSVKYLSLIAGHTKFGPDRCFGIIKRSFKLNYISSIYEFANMVESSSTGVNKAQLVGTHDGTVIVPVYEWSSFLEQFFKRVPNIKNYHHFRFSKDKPGIVYFKESSTSQEQSMMLLKNRGILPRLHNFQPNSIFQQG